MSYIRKPPKAQFLAKKIKIIELGHEKNGFLHMRKQDADKHRGNREADQRLCFRHTDSAIRLLSKSEISLSLAIFCGFTEDLFSYTEAHITTI